MLSPYAGYVASLVHFLLQVLGEGPGWPPSGALSVFACLVSSDAHQDSTTTRDLPHVPGAASGAIATLPTLITLSDVSVRRRRTPRSRQARSTRRG